LLLADFGLSRMKNESSDSCTPFHGGGTSNYTAPECIVGEQQYHGSKSDMWSFGGILCDLVAWMMGGVQLLDRFQNDRKRTAMGIKSSRFHIGGGASSCGGRVDGNPSPRHEPISSRLMQFVEADAGDKPSPASQLTGDLCAAFHDRCPSSYS
jgi:serine/threonine protein kinase